MEAFTTTPLPNPERTLVEPLENLDRTSDAPGPSKPARLPRRPFDYFSRHLPDRQARTEEWDTVTEFREQSGYESGARSGKFSVPAQQEQKHCKPCLEVGKFELE